MKLNKIKMGCLILTLAIACLLSVPRTTHGQAIKAIFQNPHKYDGKIVQVVGKVIALHFRQSNTSNAYTTFKLTDLNGNIVSVFSSGTLLIKENDTVRVIGRYQEAKRLPPHISLLNVIDASTGSVKTFQ